MHNTTCTRQPKGRDLSRLRNLREINSACNGLRAEAERDKSRPFYVANQITGNLFTYFNTDYQLFIICLHFLQGTGIHAGAMSRLYSHTA